MERFIVNCITLVRVPVIVLLIIPALPFISTGWDSPELMFWLYVIGVLSHGLDGSMAHALLAEDPHSGFWHDLDTAWLSLGLQLAAATALFNELGTPWLLAGFIMSFYVLMTSLIEILYVQPHKRHEEPFEPVILVGSAIVWLTLGGMLAYQASESWLLTVCAVVSFAMYGSFHSVQLHPDIWEHWFKESEGSPTRW